MDSKKFLIDSSVFVAYFRKEDRFHEQALKWIESQKNLAITDYVLLEASTVLQIKEGHLEATKALHSMVFNKEIEILKLTVDELAQTIALFSEQKEKISFVDASLLVLAKDRGLTLATFDKGIVTAGSILVKKH